MRFPTKFRGLTHALPSNNLKSAWKKHFFLVQGLKQYIFWILINWILISRILNLISWIIPSKVFCSYMSANFKRDPCIQQLLSQQGEKETVVYIIQWSLKDCYWFNSAQSGPNVVYYDHSSVVYYDIPKMRGLIVAKELDLENIFCTLLHVCRSMGVHKFSKFCCDPFYAWNHVLRCHIQQS